MPYRFAREQRDYTDYSSGRVFYSMPGYPAFPVRLASEIFQRCLALREAQGLSSPCVIYDPCCGGAYHLSTLAYLHWARINKIVGSDIDERALSLAERNLALMTPDGIRQRIRELEELLNAYGKASHQAALASAKTLQKQLYENLKIRSINSKFFYADALDAEQLCRHLQEVSLDIIITDIPYGNQSTWVEAETQNVSPVRQMLEALLSVTSSATIVAIASDKQQKIVHAQYRRLERFRLGKRQIVLLKPIDKSSGEGIVWRYIKDEQRSKTSL